MTAPNRSTLFGRGIVDELARLGVDVAFAPGSRSTPLVTAACQHPDVDTFSHLDERCAAFFALGRGRRTGRPTAVVCTSGTAAANFHPAVIEADRGRVPLLALTADRPPELADSGANQTVDQEKLYGDAVRWYRDLPEPEPEGRKLRSVRTTVGRAVAEATTAPAGPVHLNARFRKPLEPTRVEGDVPEEFARTDPLAAGGREDGSPYVTVSSGRTTPDEAALERVVDAVEAAKRGLIVAGPADPGAESAAEAVTELAGTTGFPALADPLSELRFHPAVGDAPVCGGYDAYLDPGVVGEWPDPDLVVRFGASPTSKVLRKYLADTGARQFVVDPAAGWREAEFAATDLVVADAGALAGAVADRVDGAEADSEWRERFVDAEAAYWSHLADERRRETFEGDVLATVAESTPEGSTLFVSNSMPIRDLDRFGRPRSAPVSVLGNRGASGIDGIVSTALGAGSVSTGPLTIVTGDLALYHDMNGLLALGRLGVDATIVVVNNDGGGIFHLLPIEEFDPPFTEAFRTPHGLDFSPTADLYDLSFERVAPDGFADRYADAVGSDGTQVIEVAFDAGDSHRTRERIQERVVDRLG